MTTDFEVIIYADRSKDQVATTIVPQSPNTEMSAQSNETQSEPESSSDIEELLSRATNVLAGQKRKRDVAARTASNSKLISVQNGVAKLNPAVLEQQTSTTITTATIEKVSFQKGDMMRLLLW